jgi:anti-sigma B factor antagonist
MDPMVLETKVRQPAPGCQLIWLCGKIDLDSVVHFENAAQEALAANPKAILTDMSSLEYMGSCGIRVLLELNMQMERHGGQLVLIGPTGVVLAALELVGLTEVLTIVESEDQAFQLLRLERGKEASGK